MEDSEGRKMKTSNALIVVAALALASAQTASPEEKKPEQAAKQTINSDQPMVKIDRQQTIDKLTAQIEDWHEANLEGKESTINREFAAIVALLEEDIIASRIELRQSAENSALTENNAAQSMVSSKPVSDQPEQSAFEQRLSTFKTKELIAKSIKHSSAFSNKYRLLGDYVDLLRKELGMPKALLASRDKNSTGKE